MSDFIVLLLVALITTIGIELLIAYLLKFRGYDEYRVITLMNLMTNLGLNILLSIFLLFGDFGYTISLIVLEIIVVYIEFKVLYYVFMKDYRKNDLLLLAVAMNAASFILGLLMRHFTRF